ncbi:MAG TPA: phosphatase PAP2 family protein [Ferruginibacter sp.]|nr:phosphatase PAP2 family protein [Ferruginibacter sp.]
MINLSFVKSILLLLLCLPQLCLAQSIDTVSTKSSGKGKFYLKKFAIPVSLIGLGIYGTTDNGFINHNEIKEERNEYFSRFSHKADNYLQFGPIAAVYIYDAFGLKGKHDWKQQTVLMGRAQLIMMGMIIPLKKYTHILRPDSSGYTSFPSGHTAQVFMAATFFYKEYGHKYPWVSAGMFTLASGIGAFRILNNRHWVSDVLAGAGFGILSVEFSYLVNRNKPGNKSAMPDAVIPFYDNGAIGLAARYKL